MPTEARKKLHGMTTEDPHIRPATMADLAAVTDIVYAAYARYIPRIGRKPGPMLDDHAAGIAAGTMFVIEGDGGVRGLVVLLPEPDALMVDNYAVAPEAHGSGYGRRLMAFAEARAREAGFARMRLYTNVAMTESLALYLRTGWVETHRVEEAGFRRIYMEKTLG